MFPSSSLVLCRICQDFKFILKMWPRMWDLYRSQQSEFKSFLTNLCSVYYIRNNKDIYRDREKSLDSNSGINSRVCARTALQGSIPWTIPNSRVCAFAPTLHQIIVPSQQVYLKSRFFSPTFGWHFFAMAEGLDHRISKYGVLGATKNFSLLRVVQPTSTPA